MAHELESRGHATTFCVPPDYVTTVSGHGFACHPCGSPFGAHLRGTYNEATILKRVFDEVGRQFKDLAPFVERADCVIGSMLQVAAPSLCEYYAKPYAYAIFSPCYLESHEIPVPMPLGRSRKLIIRRASLIKAMFAMRSAMTPWFTRTLTRARDALNLPPVKHMYQYLACSGLLFAAFDPELTPKPTDVEEGVVTGHWAWSGDPAPDPSLTAYLNNGTPPIYCGLGSMHHHSAKSVVQQFVQACRDLGERALVVHPHASQWQLGSDVLVARHVPHRHVLPHCRLAVHHGGAGTVAVTARSGLPQMVVPHLGDQFFHAQRVAELGLGPPSLPVRKLKGDTLFARLKEALEPRYLQNAKNMAARLDNKGVVCAADLLDRSLTKALAKTDHASSQCD